MVANAQHLNELIKLHGWTIGAELGVRKGDFSEYLLANNSDLRMICVDIWATDPSLNEKHNHKQNYEIYKSKIEPYKNRVSELRMLTSTASETLNDGVLDFVFVDATHTYKAVKEDCQLWIPKLKEGGLLCGHDYAKAFDKGGVIKAVNELGTFKILPRGSNDSCNLGQVLESLANNLNVADSQTGCWFIWKGNISGI
jgi:predicted O-methyltransferase YrrM